MIVGVKGGVQEILRQDSGSKGRSAGNSELDSGSNGMSAENYE